MSEKVLSSIHSASDFERVEDLRKRGINIDSVENIPFKVENYFLNSIIDVQEILSFGDEIVFSGGRVRYNFYNIGELARNKTNLYSSLKGQKRSIVDNKNLFFCSSEEQLIRMIHESKELNIHQTCRYFSQGKTEITSLLNFNTGFSVDQLRLTKKGIILLEDKIVVLDDSEISYKEVLNACREECVDVNIDGGFSISPKYKKRR